MYKFAGTLFVDFYQGKVETVENERYIMTDQVAANLKDLARVVALCDHPVLIQVCSILKISSG